MSIFLWWVWWAGVIAEFQACVASHGELWPDEPVAQAMCAQALGGF